MNQTKWLITGAGSGIGRLMALGLAKKGAVLALVDLDQKAMNAVAEEIRRAGGSAHCFLADVRDEKALRDLKSRVSQQVGAIQGLINNAGIVHGGSFEKVSVQNHIDTYATNTVGAVMVAHLFFDDLLASSDGHLVNIASAAGMIPFPYAATYASSKWAMIGFSESIRLELKERKVKNVQVSTICPGFISTGMFQGAKPPPLVPWIDPEKLARKIIRAIETNQKFIREPFLVKLINFEKGVLPLFCQDLIYKILGFSKSMVHWKGRG